MRLKITEKLLNAVTEIAEQKFDGHFTIMKFTTNYRGGYGTVGFRDEIDEMYEAQTLEELLLKMIVKPKEIGYLEEGEQKC